MWQSRGYVWKCAWAYHTPEKQKCKSLGSCIADCNSRRCALWVQHAPIQRLFDEVLTNSLEANLKRWTHTIAYRQRYKKYVCTLLGIMCCAHLQCFLGLMLFASRMLGLNRNMLQHVATYLILSYPWHGLWIWHLTLTNVLINLVGGRLEATEARTSRSHVSECDWKRIYFKLICNILRQCLISLHIYI